ASPGSGPGSALPTYGASTVTRCHGIGWRDIVLWGSSAPWPGSTRARVTELPPYRDSIGRWAGFMRACRMGIIVVCKLDRLGGAAVEARFGGLWARDPDRNLVADRIGPAIAG